MILPFYNPKLPFNTVLLLEIFAIKTSISIKILIHSDWFITLHQSNGRCATNKYFQILGCIHDIESYFGIDNTSSLNVQIYFSHWGHLSIIVLWVSRNLFHIGWNGNYELPMTHILLAKVILLLFNLLQVFIIGCTLLGLFR